MKQPFDDLRRYADDLASEVSTHTAHRAVRSAMSARSRRPRKAVVALVTTGLLGVSNVALAAAADPAVPGDVLYGVDRAYEQVADLAGLGGPRVSERLHETGILVEQGRLSEALDLVQETLGKVLDSDDPDSEFETLVAGVQDMPAVSEEALAILVGTARAIGAGEGGSGQQIADLARQLGQRLAEERSNRPDGAGPPDDRGPNDNAGQNENAGPDGSTGPPDGSPSEEAPGPSNPNRGGNQP